MSKIKALLLQMKLDPEYEVRVAAEERLVNLFDAAQLEISRLRSALSKFDSEVKKIMADDYSPPPYSPTTAVTLNLETVREIQRLLNSSKPTGGDDGK